MADILSELCVGPMFSFEYSELLRLNGNDKRLSIHQAELFGEGSGRNNVLQTSFRHIPQMGSPGHPP